MSGVMQRWTTGSSPRTYSSQKALDSGADVIPFTSTLSATDEGRRLANRDAWQCLIDSVLIEIGRNPAAFGDVDEGIDAPTQEAIGVAVEFARYAREQMLAAPGQTLPDGEGGLVIQHALPEGATESFEANRDGSWELWLYPRAPQPPIKIDSSEASAS